MIDIYSSCIKTKFQICIKKFFVQVKKWGII